MPEFDGKSVVLTNEELDNIELALIERIQGYNSVLFDEQNTGRDTEYWRKKIAKLQEIKCKINSARLG